MVIRYLDENTLYETFLDELIEIMGFKNFNSENKSHAEWLKKRLKAFVSSGAKSMCLFSDYDMPLGFIMYTFDSGLDGVFVNGRADINLIAVKEHHRGKGYGSMLIAETENMLREEGADYLCVDTYDDKDDPRAVLFYIKNRFSPIMLHPNGQIYFYKKL